MSKKIISFTIVFSLILITLLILINSNEVINSVILSIDIWQNNLLPAIFPFFIISELLIQYGFVDFLGELFKGIMGKVFKLKGECAFVLAMSMVSGFPSGAKYTRSLLDQKIINEHEASKLLTFTHFSNPLFIIGTIGSLYLQNKKLSLLILIIHFLTNFIVGFLFRNIDYPNIKYEHGSIKKAFIKMHSKRLNSKENFGIVLTNAIYNSFKTLVLMLGIIIFFLIITTLFNSIFNLNPYNRTIISGLLEMTQGVKYTSILNINLITKAMLIIFFISFGGLSVHMQIISIISGTKIKYFPFLIARIIHASLASLFLFIIFNLFF